MSEYEVEWLSSLAGCDFSEWDDFVNESPQGCVSCYSWWLKTVCKDGFDLLVLRKEENIVAGVPLIYSSPLSKRFISGRGLSPFQAIMLAKTQKEKYSESLSEEMKILKNIISQIPTGTRVQFNCHPNFTNWLPFFWAGFNQTTGYTYICENIKHPDIIWGGLRSNIRTDINKAKKLGLNVAYESDFGIFWDIILKTYKRQGRRPSFTRNYLESIYNVSYSHNAGKIIIAYDQNKVPYAGLFYVWTKNTAYFIISGADPKLRNVGASSFIYWEGILGAAKVADRVNFCGSVMPAIECVLRGFGAIQTPCFQITKNTLPVFFKVLYELRVMAGKLLRKTGLRYKFLLGS
ncbi:MAG: GNAT family N-acetyltransferase [Planctomycetota bacterium]